MQDFVITLRRQLVPEVKNLTARGIHSGSQTFVLWKNRQFAANRRRSADLAEAVDTDSLCLEPGLAQALVEPSEEADREEFRKSFQKFCATFPDAFYVSERARVYLDPEKEKKLTGRLLSAGFHSQMGYFRDDRPLYEMLLEGQEQHELDALWRELDFITTAPMRQHTGFIWFERTDSFFMMSPEFAIFRAEDKDVTSEAKIQQLSEVYLAKARRNGASDVAIEAIERHFRDINAQIRWVEQAHLAAEPSHLAAMQTLAERAYRRPLSQREREDLAAFYDSLRNEDELGHEEALRDTLVSVLMSPHFLYRIDSTPWNESENDTAIVARKSGGNNASGRSAGQPPYVQSLSDYDLASRLSYFLWSSMPDDELFAHAAAGDLHRRRVLLSQTRRMLNDDRIHGLATEFGGNWLDFRRFEDHNAVDRERFPMFNDELRESMFEEPIHFFVNLVQKNRSVLDFLYADYTFVNPALAEHYGVPRSEAPSEGWGKIENVDRFQRGGLLPMSVFLTQNAPGLRTSPVKRGYWVVRRVLGEEIPPPPPDVPTLPDDESKSGDLTLREMLARHREDKSCAACHERFDSMGLVFEGYGPVGELRTRDLGDRPVDTRATFPDGSEGMGLDGLRDYLKAHREEDFLDNLCRKLLTYALGRSLMLSDEPLVAEMRTRLASRGYRFGALVESIVTSRQFLNKRVPIELTQQ